MKAIFPWNLTRWQHVIQMWQDNRLPHALLCCGAPGMGKSAFVQQFAQTLLCEKPQTDGQACGICKSCHLLAGGNHPDLLRIEPAEVGKKIQIEQIRQAIQFCTLTAHYARYQVIIINPAEAMNANAANGVLKLLEEPPAKTLMLLVSHQPRTLLATVLSRCQRLDFSDVDHTMTQTWLQSQISAQQDARLLLNLVNQAPLAALHLATSEVLDARKRLFTSLIQLLTQQVEPISVAEQWNGYDIKQTLQWMLSWTMDLIRIKMTRQTYYLVNYDWQDALQQLSKQFTSINLFKLLDLQTETYKLVNYTSSIKSQGLLEAIAITWLEFNVINRRR